jgi:hypothetical protein
MSWKKVIKTLSSLKLAVIIIAYLCVVIAIGTIVESRFDSAAAKARVYDSVWMFIGMGALSLSLIAVMVDRWPWKKRHVPFILAHIGILFIILGSVLTLRWGLDGNMVVNIGESQKNVTINEQQIVIYASFDGNRLSKVFEKDVNFLKNDLTKNPITVDTGEGQFKFTEFKPYVIPSRQVGPSEDPMKGAGLRFQVSNGQFQHIDWLVQKKKETAAVQDLGPLRVRLGEASQNSEKRNEVALIPNGSEINYKVFSKDQEKAVLTGTVKEGSDITLPWMGLKLKVLRYHPRADERWDIQEREHPTPLTVPAVKLTYKNEDHWIVLNDTLRIFSSNTGYFVSYINKRVELGFDIKLKEFIKENYAGTMKAMAYKSIVEVPEIGTHEISMNEPLNWKGLTFYQASFQEDEFGKPVSSVFSVNYDPGRPLKYGGSLIMTLGIILLFYNRRQKGKT